MIEFSPLNFDIPVFEYYNYHNFHHPLMSLFFKWLGGSLLSVLPFLVVIDVASPMERSIAEYARPFSRIEERAGELARATRRLFTAKVSPNMIGSSFLASDPEHLRARNAYLASTFEPRNDHHLFTKIVEENEVVYEIRGLKLRGPYPQTVDATARAIGINSGLIYHYEAEGYRIVSGKSAVNEWKPGTPPGLGNLTLIRQGAEWHVEASGVTLRQ